MSVKTTSVINKSQNEEHRLPCRQCHIKTKHRVMQSVDIDNVEGTPPLAYWWEDLYQIVQCNGCEEISFREVHGSSDSYVEVSDGDDIYIPDESLYPSRVAGRRQLSDMHFLPSQVANIYKETHSALCNKMPVLAGIGIRALIETVCKEKEASGKNLKENIDSLVALGVLTKDGAEILHSLRTLGNDAAHEVKPHSDEQLSIAMNVVEHLLNGVYILPQAASKLPKQK
ncbi:MAG: DUF4145 domain-containing protein [Acidobacteria bacterium]|nr:DUF4145 domain-containing protein [Acidobacteriota bacterium]MBI3425945.1 DUF4145 domain-containing protein [Acidobacteriota bacterium]